MPGAPYPPQLNEPIASDAASEWITNPMPDAPTGTNAASVQQGFPPVTMQNILAGGLPPDGQDMNGFLFLISSHTMYLQCGQTYQYNSALASIIGGYAAGTILGMLDGTGLWLNVSAGNTSDPDTGGAGWVPIAAYGAGTVTGIATGVVTPAASVTKYPVLILEGVLTGNVSLILPETNQQWLIVNETTGAFSITAKTAAGGSTGVVIPQGGLSAPTGVYSIGDGNIYPTVAPLSVSISQDPDPLTLAERDNTGSLFAYYFNGATGLENPTVGSVIVVNSAGDGYFRKISLSNFAAQIKATILASAALTGTPTAPTAASGTRSTQVATTAFANPAATIAQNGSMTTPSGIIIKWGTFTLPAAGSVNTNFASPFPTACFVVVPSQGDSASYGYPFAVDAISASGFTVGAAAGGINSGTGYYIAIGH